MYTLYYSPGSCSLIVHCLLEEFGVPFEVKRVDAASKEVQAGVKARGAQKLLAYFREQDAALTRQYWSGDTLTAADFYFMVIARWGRRLEPAAPRMHHIAPFYTRMTTRPAVARVMEREGITPLGT